MRTVHKKTKMCSTLLKIFKNCNKFKTYNKFIILSHLKWSKNFRKIFSKKYIDMNKIFKCLKSGNKK